VISRKPRAAVSRYTSSMYRDERDAMLTRLDALSKSEEMNESLKRELLELRRAASMTPAGDPYINPRVLGPGERAVLGAHQLEAFPVWAAGILHFISFGLFSVIFYGIQQGRMPRAVHNDPSTGQAIGFQFIPFFNLYWTFFSPLRLCDRITLQYRLRGRSDEAPKAMVLASAVCSMIPYVNFLSLLILWTISTCLLQYKINQLIALGPVELKPQLEAG
jgi:hypothetical protein